MSALSAPSTRRRPRGRRGAAALIALGLLSACTPAPQASADLSPADPQAPAIVASTPIIADLVRAVAPDSPLSTLIPMGADPHSFEPSMAQIRDIAHADIAFSNGLLLERASLSEQIDANLPTGAPHIALGVDAVPFGARPIPLVEDLALSTVWLGLRVDGSGTRDSRVVFEATDASGPGAIAAFTTGAFGEPSPWIATRDGIDARDRVELPTNAHTHMSWGFTEAGIHSLTLRASLRTPAGDTPLGEATLVFAVGVDPHSLGRSVLDSGHADLTASLSGGMALRADSPAGELAPDRIVIAVPETTATELPNGSWRFLADPGDSVRILAQAVIGTHVHGEIDPHLWHDVRNAIAYTELIADRLAALDPARATEYRANAAARRRELASLDEWISEVIGTIPAAKRSLVTAHDSFGYYAKAYGLRIGGFVAPSPALEPSALHLANLARLLAQTPASGVFVEANSRSHHGELAALARTTGKSVCELRSDTLDSQVPTYTALMEFNTRSIASCLDPASLPAWPFAEQTSIPRLQGDQ